MAITDVNDKNGNMKGAGALATAIHWIDIQRQMKELTFQQFKEVILQVIQHFENEVVE
jgi:hypothetical protein